MKTTTKPSRRPRRPSKPTGIKALLVALTLGGTLGGWAGLAAHTVQQPSSSTAPIVTASVQASQAGAPVNRTLTNPVAATLPPIPTVVPPPDFSALATTTSIQPSSNQPLALAPIPAVPQPVIRRPIARTRSSR